MTKLSETTPYKNSNSKRNQVEEMFDNISTKYDMLNRILSLGIDIGWRKKTIKMLKSINPKKILDVATGTGDFAFEALNLNPDIVYGIDISNKMLDVARIKMSKIKGSEIIKFECQDSENLSFGDNEFDAITVGFGVRNFQNLEKGLSELYRVLSKGGKIMILEPSFPTNPIMKALFIIHFKYITPIIGKLFTKDNRAYSYLPESVEAFPQREKFIEILIKTGFEDSKYHNLTFGTCVLYSATK